MPPCTSRWTALGKVEELPALRKRAFHERAAARVFPRASCSPGRKRSFENRRPRLQQLQEENVNHPDLADRASSETDRAIELRARDRQRKLISKIDAALQRIEDNTYGYCEETGRADFAEAARSPSIATLSVEAQERHEKREKVYRDSDFWGVLLVGVVCGCRSFTAEVFPLGQPNDWLFAGVAIAVSPERVRHELRVVRASNCA